MAEFAQRQVDLYDVLRTETSPVELEAYGLAQPVGVAIARRDTSEFRLSVRGSAHVYVMDFDDVEHILAEEPLVSARMELALDLPAHVTTQHLTTQTWMEQRVQDPVVELFSGLHAKAVRFNERQPRTRVRLDISRLRAQLAAAHARDQQLATLISERITIGGRRGHRPTRACGLRFIRMGRRRNLRGALRCPRCRPVIPRTSKFGMFPAMSWTRRRRYIRPRSDQTKR